MPGTWRVAGSLSPAERADVEALLVETERRAHDEALTEDQREALAHGRALRHLLREDAGRLTGYAVVAPGDPPVAEPSLGAYDDALARTIEARGGPAALLLRAVPPETVAGLRARGWRTTRALERLRRPLPAPPPDPTDLVVRAFRPGEDEAVWLAQNNAAFAGHPTQGHLTLGRLHEKLAQPWFDPAGFLLFFDGDTLVASCWTKVHRFDHDDVGEIYVISVAPSAQRHGLGRLAVLHGLAHLYDEKLAVAELFVEEENVRARALYAALGFVPVARVVELSFDPQPAPTARPTP